MEHLYFFLLNFCVFLIIIFLDKKKYKDYLLLILFALILAFVFENFTIHLGLWYYHSEPKILFLSLYTWLLYIPYLSFCYFVSNKVAKHVWCFIIMVWNLVNFVCSLYYYLIQNKEPEIIFSVFCFRYDFWFLFWHCFIHLVLYEFN